ncbi:ubiquitin-specific protease [Thraustotheca clavata]|uniref:ubiquitinyl hydrolase 1 n=1 Tax=Thraustotheca clavata TaxID=74557 RepID=A0A1V9YXE6_9STRA|nr:ubiquitin-specific protease [Thraustotheca clavata]
MSKAEEVNESLYVPVTSGWTKKSIGMFLESREVQLVMIGLITIDVVTALMVGFLAQNESLESSLATWMVVLNGLLQTMTGFTLMVFVLELVALCVVFQQDFFTHLGYGLDFITVGSSLAWELQYQSKALRVLGMFRYWRVFRFVHTLLNEEVQKRIEINNLLEKERLINQQQELNIRLFKDSLEQEYSAKKQLNQTLQEYKDEIDTLKEALNIAAMAVAGRDIDEYYFSDEDQELRSPQMASDDMDEFADANEANLSRLIPPFNLHVKRFRLNGITNMDDRILRLTCMAKSAASGLPSPSSASLQLIQPTSATTTGAIANNNKEITEVSIEAPDMLHKMERMVQIRGGRKKTSSIDTASSNRMTGTRFLSRAARAQRESPRLQPLSNQNSIAPTPDTDEKKSMTEIEDDDGNASTIQLPPAANHTSYPGYKEPVKTRVDETRLDTLTISIRQATAGFPSNAPSVVMKEISIHNKGLVGLQNLGNTCCLQCLSNVPGVMKYFQQSQHLQELNDGSQTQGKLACVFGDLIHTLWQQAEFTATRPVELKRAVGKLASRYEQHDAQEFLRFLLDGLHEDLNRVKKKPAYYEIPDRPNASDKDISEEYWQFYVQRNYSALSEQFCGQLRSEVTCQVCNHRSVCFDVFWDLSIPVPKKGKSMTIRFGGCKAEDDGGVAIQDCLKAYMEEENIKEDDAYYCSKCKTHRPVIKKINLQRCPQVLVLHLKRFSYSTFSRDKISTAIRFPAQGLNLQEFCTKDNICYDKCWDYDLIGVINHMGTLNGGHYTAECRNTENEQWYDFNDQTVSSIKTPCLSSSSAYILFYQRRCPA